MNHAFVANPLCSCRENQTCTQCLFCDRHNTPGGRKSLCERIVHFLVFRPSYQRVLARATDRFFPSKIIYDDEKDICSLMFEAVLFEDSSGVLTPLAYFIGNADLSADERRLYEAWRQHTRYGFFMVDRVLPGEGLHLTELAGGRRYRVYETSGTATIKEGSVIIARLVPFLKGWMISTEIVLSFSGSAAREQVEKKYGLSISQLDFVQKYHAEHKRRMGM